MLSILIRWLKVKFFGFKPSNRFDKEKLKCPCCGEGGLKLGTLKRLNISRYIAAVPFVETSGFRCSKRNKLVGGKETSSHLKGRAIDIYCETSRTRFIIVVSALLAGFTRIGIGKNFIHLDDDFEKPQLTIWIY